MDGKKLLFNADEAEEYFTMLCTSYRDTANDIFRRDNEGRHASEQIYSAEYQKYLGMQIAMWEVLEYFSKFELVDHALLAQQTIHVTDLYDEDGGEVYRAKQEHFREGTKKVEPLTPEELRQMDGEPVWVRHRHGGEWVIVHWNAFDVIAESLHDVLFRHEYGKTWLAYRHKPEEVTV